MDPRIKRLYWQISALLLAAHFAGWAAAMPLSLALTALQTLHFLARHRRWRHFEIPVRAAYLALLLAGHLPGLWPIHLLRFVGVNALQVTDYCLLARLLVLLPWNRLVPLSLGLLRWLVPAHPPRPGWTGCSVRSTTRAGGPRNQRLASQFDNCARQAPDVRRLAAPLNTSDLYCKGQLQWT